MMILDDGNVNNTLMSTLLLFIQLLYELWFKIHHSCIIYLDTLPCQGKSNLTVDILRDFVLRKLLLWFDFESKQVVFDLNNILTTTSMRLKKLTTGCGNDVMYCQTVIS